MYPTGLQNTTKIIAACGNLDLAARYCSEFEIDGYHDWFLPGINEINSIARNRFKGWMWL